MDEEVINDLFSRAKSKGYSKGIEDFKLLLSNDDEVFNDNFEYVQSKGYKKSIEEFSILVDAKKKGILQKIYRFLQSLLSRVAKSLLRKITSRVHSEMY